jgi:hypothetical protein
MPRARAKAQDMGIDVFSARLKPCPDTKLLNLASSLKFSGQKGIYIRLA